MRNNIQIESNSLFEGLTKHGTAMHRQKWTTKLYCDDCLNVMEHLPSHSIDMVITSPPYNLGKAYEKKVALDEYLLWQKEIIKKLHLLLRDTGSLCWQTGNFVNKGEVFPLDIYFYPILKELGFKLRNRIIWHFGHGLHASNRFSGRYETLLWFTKEDDYKFNLDDIRVPAKYPSKKHFKGKKRGQLSGNPSGKNPSDFWEFIQSEFDDGLFNIPNVKANHPEKMSHPCQFPVELVERCVLAFTDEGDTILDPFSGVGTTGIAALKRGRNSILIEKDSIYHDAAVQRISDFRDGRSRTREIGTAIHQPKATDQKLKATNQISLNLMNRKRDHSR